MESRPHVSFAYFVATTISDLFARITQSLWTKTSKTKNIFNWGGLGKNFIEFWASGFFSFWWLGIAAFAHYSCSCSGLFFIWLLLKSLSFVIWVLLSEVFSELGFTWFFCLLGFYELFTVWRIWVLQEKEIWFICCFSWFY